MGKFEETTLKLAHTVEVNTLNQRLIRRLEKAKSARRGIGKKIMDTVSTAAIMASPTTALPYFAKKILGY